MYGKENILIIAVLAVILTIATLNRIECHEDGLDEHEHAHKSSDVEQDEDTTPPEVDENEIEYQKGSVCGYCEYCKVFWNSFLFFNSRYESSHLDSHLLFVILECLQSTCE